MEKTTATDAAAVFATSQAKTATASSPKQQFRDAFQREGATTRRVITSLPKEKSEFRPHPRSQTAREIAAIFALGQGGIAAALTGNWTWPPSFPPTPDSMNEVLANFDATHKAVLQALENTPDARLFETVPFMTGPNQMGDVKVVDLMWFMLLDAIHHRGQLSVYVRMAGGKVPSIYGPSADEPWM